MKGSETHTSKSTSYLISTFFKNFKIKKKQKKNSALEAQTQQPKQ